MNLKLRTCVLCGIERDAFLSFDAALSQLDYTHCDCPQNINKE